MKIQKIVYPTDFSRCSDQALGYAAFAASLFHAELHMLHGLVLHDDDPHNPEHHFPDYQELEKKMKTGISKGMDELMGALKFQPAMALCSQRRGFDASEVILEYLHEVDADLVVMGTHGRRGPTRMLLGSVANKVVRWAHCPVLTVPEVKEPRGGDAVKTIIVPVDFSALSQRAAHSAAKLAELYKADLVLLHVVDLPAYPSFYDTSFLAGSEEMKRKSFKALQDLSHELELEHPPTLEVRFGGAATEILTYCETKECDLIVMGNQGLGGFRLFGLGSTAERVVRRSRTPVLTIRSKDKEEEEEGEG